MAADVCFVSTGNTQLYSFWWDCGFWDWLVVAGGEMRAFPMRFKHVSVSRKAVWSRACKCVLQTEFNTVIVFVRQERTRAAETSRRTRTRTRKNEVQRFRQMTTHGVMVRGPTLTKHPFPWRAAVNPLPLIRKPARQMGGSIQEWYLMILPWMGRNP